MEPYVRKTMAEKLVNNELRESSVAEPHESQVAPPNPNLRDVRTKVEIPPPPKPPAGAPRPVRAPFLAAC